MFACLHILGEPKISRAIPGLLGPGTIGVFACLHVLGEPKISRAIPGLLGPGTIGVFTCLHILGEPKISRAIPGLLGAGTSGVLSRHGTSRDIMSHPRTSWSCSPRSKGWLGISWWVWLSSHPRTPQDILNHPRTFHVLGKSVAILDLPGEVAHLGGCLNCSLV